MSLSVKDASARASHVVGKGEIPILGCLRFADGRIMSSDIAQQLDIPIEFPPSLSGANFCVSASRLMRVLNALPKDSVPDFRATKKKLHINAGTARFELNTFPSDDFPLMKQDDATRARFEAVGKDLVAALKFVVTAMPTKDIRYYLNGVHFALPKGGRLMLTATDGHRLHRTRVDVEADAKTPAIEGTIPAASIARVIELAERHTKIAIEAGATRLVVGGDETLSTSLLDGKFPDASKVIPSERPSTGGCAREAFSETIRRVQQVLVGDQAQGVRFDFQPEKIELLAKNAEGEIAAETFTWHAADQSFRGIEIGLDVDYFRQALEAFTGDNIFLHLAEDSSSVLYLTDGGDREAAVMPFKL